MANRPFNPLNGEELKVAILNEIKRHLDADTRFRQHLAYPQVAFSVGINIATFPADASPGQIAVQSVIGPTPEGETMLQPPAVAFEPVGEFVAEGRGPLEYRGPAQPESIPAVQSVVQTTRETIEDPLSAQPSRAQFTTQAGVITGGAKPGPTVIINPDQARRDMGRPVPTPTMRHGVLVDVPLEQQQPPADMDQF
ncbi:MAG: hypothetical protein AB7Q45_17660 [Planctomycetaceae bacterium]